MLSVQQPQLKQCNVKESRDGHENYDTFVYTSRSKKITGDSHTREKVKRMLV